MNTVYENAHDVHVRANVFYADADEGKLYYENDFENQVTKDDLEDAFVKGTLLIANGDSFLKAVELDGNVVKTLYVDDDTDAIAFNEWAAKE